MRRTRGHKHAVCIFPFRAYEGRALVLYAKSRLKLIVNNRIGKVGFGLPRESEPEMPHGQAGNRVGHTGFPRPPRTKRRSVYCESGPSEVADPR
jgi:hypothetical protein